MGQNTMLYIQMFMRDMANENLIQIFASSFRQNWELPALSEFGTGHTMTYADLSQLSLTVR